MVVLLVHGVHQVVGRVGGDLRPVVRGVEGDPRNAYDRRSLVGPLRVLLHVLRQIRLLRVALPAVLADVSLEMLALLVFGDVLQQRGLVGEALIAGVALVGLVGLMAPRVALQVAQLAEGLVAPRVATLVRLVARVRADVLLQVGQLGELALADLAAVRLDTEVDARVLRQV